MQQARCLCVFLIFTFIGLGVACSNNAESPEMAEQLVAANREIQTLQTENQGLKDAYHQLSERYDTLQLDCTNLKIQNNELTSWAKQLTEKFGPAIWYFGKDERPLPYKSMKNATADLLVQELNTLFKASDLPMVSLNKTMGHTAYVRIIGDRQLTQQMGTTGATGYIEVVTYTLTSLSTIDSVEFEFKEGDHALPGRYTR